ncbi:hypothetical protein ACS0TY_006207 [Phlomoides rotata]
MTQLERDLNNIWIGSYKLRANISKFARKGEKNGRKPIVVAPATIPGGDRKWALRTENKSYL